MQTQATRPLVSGLTRRQARTLWVTLVNARNHARENGALSEDLGALAEDVESAFDEAWLFGPLEICEYNGAGSDVYLAPYEGDFTGLDMRRAIRSATATTLTT